MAIQTAEGVPYVPLDCFASLAMTIVVELTPSSRAPKGRGDPGIVGRRRRSWIAASASSR
jgi:hypothetical protein